MREYIAERSLLYSSKGKGSRLPMHIRISAPYTVNQDEVSFTVDGDISGCHVDIVGIDEPGFEIYGMDSLQAINLASDIDPLIQRLSKKYDFFWSSGEPYFDE